VLSELVADGLTPCLKVPQVQEETLIPIERDRITGKIIKNMHRCQRQTINAGQRSHDVDEPSQRLSLCRHDGRRIRYFCITS